MDTKKHSVEVTKQLQNELKKLEKENKKLADQIEKSDVARKEHIQQLQAEKAAVLKENNLLQGQLKVRKTLILGKKTLLITL